MNKKLLTGLTLATVLALPFGTHAEKTYVQLTSGGQLAEGAKYAIGFVSTHASYQTDGEVVGRFYYRNDNGKAAVHAHADVTSFDDNELWMLKSENYVCSNINADHLSHDYVFSVYQNVNGAPAYIRQGEPNSNNAQTAPTLEMVAQANAKTATEFVKVPARTGFTGEQLFTQHVGWNNSYFMARRAVYYDITNNKPNQFDKYSNADNTTFSCNTNGEYAELVRVYLEIDTENLTEAANAYWNVPRVQAATWAASIDDELVAAIKAMPLPTNVEWNVATLEAQAESAFLPALQDVVANYLNGKSVTFTNIGNSLLLAPASDGTHITKTTISDTSAWIIEAVETGGFVVKNAGNGKYVGTLPASSNSAWISLVDNKQNAGVYGVVIADENTHATFIRAFNGLSTVNQWHTNQANLQAWSGTGSYSQFKIELFNPFKSAITLRDEYIAMLSPYEGYTLFTDDEITSTIDALNAISFDNPSYSEGVRESKTQEVHETFNKIWDKYTNPVLIKFFRNNAYLSCNEEVATSVSDFSVNALWYLQHTENMNFRLHSIGGDVNLIKANADEAEGASDVWTFIIGASSTNNEVGSGSWIAMRNATRNQTNNVLHKSGGTNNNYIWYNANDQGSALQVISDWEAIKEFITGDITNLDFTSDGEFGKLDIAAYREFEYALNSLDPTNITKEQIDEIASLHEIFSTVPVSCYVTIKPSPESGVTQSSSLELYYSLAMNGNMTTFTGEGKTEANSIWFSNDAKLLNYWNGMYINASNANFLNCNSQPQSNSGTAILFKPGYQEEGTWQLIYNNGRGLHAQNHSANGYAGWSGNVCGVNNYEARNEKAHNFVVETVSEIPVAIHSDGFGSIISPLPLLSPGNVTTYVAEIKNDELHFTAVEGANLVIAPNTHVLVKGTPGETVHIAVGYGKIKSDYNYVPESHSQLTGSHVARQITAAEGMNYYAKQEVPAQAAYIMPLAEEAPKANFNKLAVENGMVTIPAGAMVVALPSDLADEETLEINPDGKPIPTGINEVYFEKGEVGGIYDLQGRRLSAPVKGINIINGKKVLVK